MKISVKKRGFSLVELMVALVLGLLVVAGAVQFFIVGKSGFNKVEELSKRQEALRFVADVMSVDVRTAKKRVGTNSSDGVYVDAGNDELVLTYPNGGRKDTVYCSSGSLYRLWYKYSSDADGNGTLGVDYDCDGDGSRDLGSFQHVVNVSDVAFQPEHPSLRIEVTFEPINSNESAGLREFSFKIVNRASVMDIGSGA